MKEVERIHNIGRKITLFPFKVYYADASEGQKPLLTVSVPKKLFKRAVKRNLIRRRIKEAFRHLLPSYPAASGKDFLIVYISKEISDYATIGERLGTVLEKIS